MPTLVAPRVLACALALPFLTVVLDAAAVLGGLAAELTAGGMTAQVYWQKSLLLLKLSVIVPATLKTAAFGLLAFVAPQTLDLAELTRPRALPILAVGIIQLVPGLLRREAWRPLLEPGDVAA